MKKLFLLLFLGIAAIGGYKLYQFYAFNLSGAKPAIAPPTGDIVKELSEAKNFTGLPLKLPAGFSVSVFAKDLSGPRVLTWDPSDTLLVSIPSQGKIVALPDKNHDGVSDETVTVMELMNKPHGLAFRVNNRIEFYIAEEDEVAVYDYDPKSFRAGGKRSIMQLPTGGNHVTRTIGFGPDGRLYVVIGSSCNVCIEKDERRTKIFSLKPDGTDLKEVASGLRNSVFFTWHPVTRQLWATEMGRDLIGDDIPPDEINIITEGKFYGWPYCYGKNVLDKNFDASDIAKERCTNAQASYIDIPAHSAPLGLTFIPSSSNWPQSYWNNLFVSYHGSWNRSVPTGYKVVRYKLDEQGNYLGVEDFLTGWLAKDGALGRPVDLLFDKNGTLYVSDDKAGVIYRVTYAIRK